MEKKQYKVLFADLDGTLIDTVMGGTSPKGIWDMVLKFPVLDAIKILNPDRIIIVTNQGGIEKGILNEYNFNNKATYICTAIEEYTDCDCEYDYCTSNDKNDKDRKPNTGMLEYSIRRYAKEYKDKSKMLMIGDASGLEGQFSDSDKKTAENFGIDYLDVGEFIRTYSPSRKNQPISNEDNI